MWAEEDKVTARCQPLFKASEAGAASPKMAKVITEVVRQIHKMKDKKRDDKLPSRFGGKSGSRFRPDAGDQ